MTLKHGLVSEASLGLLMGKSFCILASRFERVVRISIGPKEQALRKVASQGQKQAVLSYRRTCVALVCSCQPRRVRGNACQPRQHDSALLLPAPGTARGFTGCYTLIQKPAAQFRTGLGALLPANICLFFFPFFFFLYGLCCHMALVVLPSARHSLALLLSNSARSPKS